MSFCYSKHMQAREEKDSPIHKGAFHFSGGAVSLLREMLYRYFGKRLVTGACYKHYCSGNLLPAGEPNA